MSDFLVGKTIKDMKIADDKKAIIFICDDGNHIARADGDCCSDTWIETIESPALGFPCKVLQCGDLELFNSDLDDQDGEMAYYGFGIKTDKGEIVIDYRNLSNGYYGGSIVWPDEYFYGGVYEQNVSSENWVDIEWQ